MKPNANQYKNAGLRAMMASAMIVVLGLTPGLVLASDKHPVYVPPPIYNVPMPSPGITLVLPLNFRR